jgi:hypothetical protein
VSDNSSSQRFPEPGSLVGLIEGAGFVASPDVVRLQEFAAAAEQYQFDVGASGQPETTRSTALWSAMVIDPAIGAGLERAGIDKATLAAHLSISSETFTKEPATLRCHEDLSNAMTSYLRGRTTDGPVAVAEVVLAVLVSAQDRTIGVISSRIGDVSNAIAAMRSVVDTAPQATAFDPDEFSGSVRELRGRFVGSLSVTPGRIAAALQTGEAHRDYAGGRFRGVRFSDTGPQASFDEWALRVRGLYDMNLVRAGRQRVIDGRMFLLALADLDDSFAGQLADNGVRDALASEVDVPTLAQPPPGDLEGGVSSEFVDPTKGIDLGADRMGVAPYVSMLATVMCDKNTKMPLSVGVFGQWGSGESYFMGLLRGRIDVVSRSDQHKYCQDIKQISFNAWHYADSNLWASLGDEIFHQLLHAPDPDVERQEQLREELGKLNARRQELEATTARAETEVRYLRTQIADASVDRDVRATDLLQAMAANPGINRELEKVWRRLGISDTIERARVVAAEVRGTATEASVIRRSLSDRRGVVLAILGLLALAAVSVVALWPHSSLESLIRAVAAAASGFLATAVAVVAAARVGLRRLRETMDQIRTDAAKHADQRSATDPAEALQALRRAEAARDLSRAQLETVVARVGEVGGELAKLAPGQRLYTFLADRVTAGEYARNLGIISTIRKDFEQLNDLMREWRERRDRNEPAPRPIERIVLYIDDLDRCSPKQVVNVLQAVHLLLALDLFVVVVGVDPRWLVRSLRQEYPKLLTAPGGSARASDGWNASPEDYLEKIFGIPFILPGMKGHLEPVLKGIFNDRATTDTADVNAAEALDGGEPRPAASEARAQQSPPPESPVAVEKASEVASQIGQGEADTHAGPSTSPAVRPLSDAEIEMLGKLEPLIKTPREAKRIANVYRMIRANKDLSDASRFMGAKGQPGEYEAVVVLLGLLTASARLLGAVLDSPPESGGRGGLMSRASSETWPAFVAGMKPRWTNDLWSNDIVTTMTPTERAAWEDLCSGLQPVTEHVTLRDVNALQTWAPSLRRFSFVMSPVT